MERLFRSLKTEWLPPLGYEPIRVVREDLGRYFLGTTAGNGHIGPMGVWLLPEPNNNLKWCPIFIDHYNLNSQVAEKLGRFTSFLSQIMKFFPY